MIRRLGGKIRRLRQRDQLSQADLARRIGFSKRSRGYISEIENDKKTPPAEVIVRLALLFGVSTDYLLRDDIPMMADED
ncbi:MAG: hypothetical protein A2139_04925 [Desulfobacca sp. RBG_16_60_12]|nr:MAG: hypothetical protein A2139_04925 [Desulfobacca sp. RBG_16_60_12]